ncbi:MAG: hypothetical protein HXS44_13230 [Theionarchaea archaeon]|nr:hypothetical protein [Theionarchaea archaeon]
MKKCIMCGRTLTNPESIARGMGPVCYSKYVHESHIKPGVSKSRQQTLY